jgi:hypothetical protein
MQWHWHIGRLANYSDVYLECLARGEQVIQQEGCLLCACGDRAPRRRWGERRRRGRRACDTRKHRSTEMLVVVMSCLGAYSWCRR